MSESISREEFLKNQDQLCKEKGWPFFMPASGLCYNCRRDIIPTLIRRGEKGTALVTGCPLCLYSYCE